MKYFLYRPEGLQYRDDLLQRVVWESDFNLSALISLSVRLLGGSKLPTDVYWLPVLKPRPGRTVCRRALVLTLNGGPTAILSPVRLSAFRKFLAWSLTLSPSEAEYAPGQFAERVAREARDVGRALTAASFARVE